MKVLDKIDSDYYRNNLSWDSKKLRQCTCGESFYKLDKPFCAGCGASLEQIRINYKKEHDDFNKKYKKESDRLNNIFKEDVLLEVGLTNHPFGEKAFAIAMREHGELDFYDALELFELFGELLND